MERARKNRKKKSAQHDETIMNEINGLNLTNKRKINIENYAFEKTMYQLNFLKNVNIFSRTYFTSYLCIGYGGKGLALTIFFVV